MSYFFRWLRGEQGANLRPRRRDSGFHALRRPVLVVGERIENGVFDLKDSSRAGFLVV